MSCVQGVGGPCAKFELHPDVLCVHVIQELIAQARSGMTGGDAFKEALEVIETKFAWLVYITATFVGSRPVSNDA